MLTFKENLVNVASEETKKLGEELIKKELDKMEDGKFKQEVVKRLKEIEEGKKDLYF